MGYKHDLRYRIGISLAVISVIDMIVTFALMGLGSDPAIIWFMLGGVVLVISNFIIISAKRRYEQVEESNVTRIEIAKESLANAKNRLFKRGVLGVVLLFLLMACFIATAVMGIATLKTAYEKSGAINAGYHFNLREAERYEGLMEEELQKGNEKLAEEFSKNRDKCISESEWYLQYYGELSEKLDVQLSRLVVMAAINAVVLAVYIAFVLAHKKTQAEEIKS